MTLTEVRVALINAGVPACTADLFVQYHIKKPDVWFKFEAEALKQVSDGQTKLFSKQIAENLRCECARNGDEFAIDNRFVSYYGRMFEIKYPQCSGYFEKKEVKGINSLKPAPVRESAQPSRQPEQIGLFGRRAA